MASGTSTSRPDKPQLKHYIGIVGLLFVSIGSIIGSGWLFRALTASKETDPPAVISWALGAVMVPAIALAYAELRVIFPLLGPVKGVVRYPRLAFGCYAKYSTGWITWVGASTTTPIELLASLPHSKVRPPHGSNSRPVVQACTP